MSSIFVTNKLQDIAKIFSGNSINEKVKEKHYTGLDSGINYIATKDISFNSSINYNNGIIIPFDKIEKFKIAPKNTVFICAEGGSAGRKVAISDRELCFVNKLFAVVATEKVLPKYIFYFLKSEEFLSQFYDSLTGLIGGVSLNKFKELKIIVPSLPIQQKIVEKLDAIFAEIDRAVAAAEANAKKSYAVYSSAVDSVFDKLDDKTVKLSSCSDIGYGYTSKSSSQYSGLQYLRITDIQEDSVDWLLVPKIDAMPSDVEKYLLKDGDIVFARTGATTGKSFLIKDPPPSVFASYLIRVDVNREYVEPEYLRHFFKSEDYWLTINAGISGAAQGGFNASKLGNLTFPLPNLATQQKIVKKLDAIETHSIAASESQKSKVKELNFLRNSILKQAFAGELVKE